MPDYDGKVLDHHHSKTSKSQSEHKGQLQGIPNTQNILQSEDGVVSDENLKRATGLPLPRDELLESGDALNEAVGTTSMAEKSPKTWRSRIANPFRAVSMPTVRIPSRKPQKDVTPGAEKSPTVISKDRPPVGARSCNVENPVETVEYTVAENLVRVTTKELPKDEAA